MDKKSLQKLIVMFFVIFIVGFGLLLVYYFNYANETEKRKTNNIENMIENQQKTLEDLVKEKGSNLQSTKKNDSDKKDSEQIETLDEYKDYVNEQLNISSSETDEEVNNAYKQAIQQIRIAAIGFDFNQVANLANKALSDHVFEDGNKYSTLSNISFLYGFKDMTQDDQFTLSETITDPVVYMSVFYAMEPEYQIERLKNEQHIYVPINESNQPSLIAVEKGGAAESRASEFFSDLTTVEITKITIEVAGTEYYIYVVGKNGYSYRITNIEMSSKTNDTRTTYADYFKMWGRKEIKIKEF